MDITDGVKNMIFSRKFPRFGQKLGVGVTFWKNFANYPRVITGILGGSQEIFSKFQITEGKMQGG